MSRAASPASRSGAAGVVTRSSVSAGTRPDTCRVGWPGPPSTSTAPPVRASSLVRVEASRSPPPARSGPWPRPTTAAVASAATPAAARTASTRVTEPVANHLGLAGAVVLAAASAAHSRPHPTTSSAAPGQAGSAAVPPGGGVRARRVAATASPPSRATPSPGNTARLGRASSTANTPTTSSAPTAGPLPGPPGRSASRSGRDTGGAAR